MFEKEVSTSHLFKGHVIRGNMSENMTTPNITQLVLPEVYHFILAVALPAVAYVRAGRRSESPGGTSSNVVGIISPHVVRIISTAKNWGVGGKCPPYPFYPPALYVHNFCVIYCKDPEP